MPTKITLTDREVKAEAEFSDMLDTGASLRLALLAVRAKYRRSCRAVFYRWLLTGRAA